MSDTPKAGAEIAKLATLETSIDVLTANRGGAATLRDGTVVTFSVAKMKHLPALVAVFNELINGVSEEDFSSIIQVIATKQQDAIAQGKSPHAVDFTEEDVLGMAIEGRSVLFTILQSIAIQISALVPMFCSLTEDEFNELDMDEGPLVLLAIVGANYSFFTQTLPRVFKDIFQQRVEKAGKAKAVKAAKSTKRVTRRT